MLPEFLSPEEKAVFDKNSIRLEEGFGADYYEIYHGEFLICVIRRVGDQWHWNHAPIDKPLIEFVITRLRSKAAELRGEARGLDQLADAINDTAKN